MTANRKEVIDLVVMDNNTNSRRESILRLREQLLTAEADRLMGKKGVPLKEVEERLRKAIIEAAGERRR